jgi:hypothetical protein
MRSQIFKGQGVTKRVNSTLVSTMSRYLYVINLKYNLYCGLSWDA